jgi:hypothetical protein
MSRSLPLTLDTKIVPLGNGLTDFEVATEMGKVTVKGHLTAGSKGWTLSAEAACRRSTITVYVTAIEIGKERHPDLERHRYQATINVRRPGRYSLRVSHVYLLRGQGGVGPPTPVFERILTVP